jgi:superoxide dismutase, Fe-Mn family
MIEEDRYPTMSKNGTPEEPGTKTSRRRFLLYAASLPTAALSLTGATNAAAPAAPATTGAGTGGAYTLPPLPYPYEALEPHIDAQTMRIHHDLHHGAYVRNLNEALAKEPRLKDRPLEALLRNLDRVPKDIRIAVRNNGGGHINHSMFWEIMKPGGGGMPAGPLAAAINQSFGSMNAFQEQFNDAGLKRFGSGWVWLVRTRDGMLQIMSTPNQDSPFIEGHYPIMGNDVWEHAYYLKYQNRRADYLKAWWNTVNWEAVSRRFTQAKT